MLQSIATSATPLHGLCRCPFSWLRQCSYRRVLPSICFRRFPLLSLPIAWRSAMNALNDSSSSSRQRDRLRSWSPRSRDRPRSLRCCLRGSSATLAVKRVEVLSSRSLRRASSDSWSHSMKLGISSSSADAACSSGAPQVIPSVGSGSSSLRRLHFLSRSSHPRAAPGPPSRGAVANPSLLCPSGLTR